MCLYCYLHFGHSCHLHGFGLRSIVIRSTSRNTNLLQYLLVYVTSVLLRFGVVCQHGIVFMCLYCYCTLSSQLSSSWFWLRSIAICARSYLLGTALFRCGLSTNFYVPLLLLLLCTSATVVIFIVWVRIHCSYASIFRKTKKMTHSNICTFISLG